MLGGDVSRGSAFITCVSHKLPTIGAVAVQCDQQVVSLVSLKVGRQELHEALLRLVAFSLKGDVFGLRRITK